MCVRIYFLFCSFYSEKPGLWYIQKGLSETQIRVSSGCKGEANQVNGVGELVIYGWLGCGLLSTENFRLTKALKSFVGCVTECQVLLVSEYSGPGPWSFWVFAITSITPQRMIWCMSRFIFVELGHQVRVLKGQCRFLFMRLSHYAFVREFMGC